MPTVYIETTIPSYYFETRTSPEAIAWRGATLRWWDEYRGGYDLVTSGFVLAELRDAPPTKAAACESGVHVEEEVVGVLHCQFEVFDAQFVRQCEFAVEPSSIDDTPGDWHR